MHKKTLMDNYIKITQLNDFIFCPISIYFHKVYEKKEDRVYKGTYQVNGTSSHSTVDNGTYRNRKNVITGLEVYSSKFNLVGKIDMLDNEEHILIERKKKVKTIYDGYVFQLYGQYFALNEMGYEVNKLKIHSMDDNKSYLIPLPNDDPDMKRRFINLIDKIQEFNLDEFLQDNCEKCKNCIYEPACDRSLV